jgi:hypothetical protein
MTPVKVPVNARMPAHIVLCDTQRHNSQQTFVVAHRHHLHHPISLLFLFVPVQALPHVHMHFVTLSPFFFSSLGILSSWSQLCFSNSCRNESWRQRPSSQFSCHSVHIFVWTTDDVKTFRSLLALKRFNVVRRFPVHFLLHPTHS